MRAKESKSVKSEGSRLSFRSYFDRDLWEEIFDSLLRNRARTFLTAFGIFWGVFMLVLLMGGGKGLESILANNFAGMASNSGFIFAGQTSEAYKGFQKGRSWNVELNDVQYLKQSVAELDIVTPTVRGWGSNASRNDKSCTCSVSGIYPDYQQVDNPKIKQGREINGVDVQQKRKVCVIGKRIAEELFPGEVNPCGQYIRVDSVYYCVVGLSGKSGGGISIGGNAESSIYMPYSVVQQMYNKGNNVDVLCLTAKNAYKMSDVQYKVEAVLKRKHLIHPHDTQAVIKVNTEAIFSMVDSLFQGVSILVWMIGLGTLFSGAIGVSNIMIVTVKERTTEIGIRRAIGATPHSILGMIMAESIVLTLVAGMSGIVFAVLILQMVEMGVRADTPEAEFQITFALAVGAAVLISLLGVLAGLAPALRAMGVKPVEAMREE